ncbi:addiction module antidote protein (plasmid) [Thalassoporum mexicanum PCC 7367]|uniref:addiction module antidote protein n=1 Tax=Thalassoporum mexicanum TaxID=3457544 RepID=UPI00029FB4C3|nr:addiction module antidote protein [Pseudanabaena sp. PCC 7367]AFY72000.1 addiction module antidote protein [Pseudanabaena sp. PCC 7367]
MSAKARNYRTFDEVTEEYFLDHPEEIESYLTTVFEEYAKEQCTAALLSSLRMVARIKGISNLAKETNISRNVIQKALSANGNPKFESISAIMHAMGYCLTPKKLDAMM